MKRHLTWLVLASYCAFGAVLIFQMATEKPVHVIQQDSRNAIINVSDSELASAMANGEVKIETRYPYSRTLIRDTSGNPTRLHGKLNSGGNIFVINPAGIIIGSDGERTTTFGGTCVHSTRESDTILRGKSIEAGNVYALATKEGGAIRAGNRSVEVRISPKTKQE